VFAYNQHSASGLNNDRRNKLSQFPIANQCDIRGWTNTHLLEDVQCRSHRLDEDRRLVGQRARYFDQVPSRERKKLGERAIAILDTKHGAIGTVPGISCATPIAFLASRVDFADNATAYERGFGRLGNATYELVTERAMKAGVAFYYFEVSAADPR
jgi:hypothetical protein